MVKRLSSWYGLLRIDIEKQTKTLKGRYLRELCEDFSKIPWFEKLRKLR